MGANTTESTAPTRRHAGSSSVAPSALPPEVSPARQSPTKAGGEQGASTPRGWPILSSKLAHEGYGILDDGDDFHCKSEDVSPVRLNSDNEERRSSGSASAGEEPRRGAWTDNDSGPEQGAGIEQWAGRSKSSLSPVSRQVRTDARPQRSLQLTIQDVKAEVLVCRAFADKLCFIFRFGCIVGWDFTMNEQQMIKDQLKPFMVDNLKNAEDDDMRYVVRHISSAPAIPECPGTPPHAEHGSALPGAVVTRPSTKARPRRVASCFEMDDEEAGGAATGAETDHDATGVEDHHEGDLDAVVDSHRQQSLAVRGAAAEDHAAKDKAAQRAGTPMIKQDRITLNTSDPFEMLAYSYAFAQSCKLTTFETVVDETILDTRALPEGLAATGKITSSREDLSKRMGELFISRFYINLHTDILDTPDIFWDFDEFSDHYKCCRAYLEIPKRVSILNQRLDIIKDLYDMLNNELTIQHGYKLEWIVIYLICIEVAIEVIWNILIRDILRWV
eukprot:Selendium_serpulae@DN4467_c0_g1_i2.p1